MTTDAKNIINSIIGNEINNLMKANDFKRRGQSE